MAKRKKINKSDAETLKHYESYEKMPGQSKPGNKKDDLVNPDVLKQPHLKKALRKASGSKSKFIKAKLVVDHVMSGRKSPVINSPSEKKSK